MPKLSIIPKITFDPLSGKRYRARHDGKPGPIIKQAQIDSYRRKHGEHRKARRLSEIETPKGPVVYIGGYNAGGEIYEVECLKCGYTNQADVAVFMQENGSPVPRQRCGNCETRFTASVPNPINPKSHKRRRIISY